MSSDRGFYLTAHCCRTCGGRVMLAADDARRYACAQGGARGDGEDASVLCCCGMPTASGRDAGVRCVVNDNRTPEWPDEVVARADLGLAAVVG